MTFDRIVVTCEHATNHVPARYAALFDSARGRAALRSHRGWDPGALAVARHLAARFAAPLVIGRVSRLLIDLNRSVGHRDVFSEFSRRLDPVERARLVRSYHAPHRQEVDDLVTAAVQRGRAVLHLGVHTFTPRFRGVVRRADLAFLYDPRRSRERALCAAWREAMRAAAPHLRVRRNYPYRGDADGLTTTLRRRAGGGRYAGIEVELNQSLVGRTALTCAEVLTDTLEALRMA